MRLNSAIERRTKPHITMGTTTLASFGKARLRLEEQAPAGGLSQVLPRVACGPNVMHHPQRASEKDVP